MGHSELSARAPGEYLAEQYARSTRAVERFDGEIVEHSGVTYPVRRWVVRGQEGLVELVVYIVPFPLSSGTHELPVAVNVHSKGPLYAGHTPLMALCPLLGYTQCWTITDGRAAEVLLQSYNDVGAGLRGDNAVFAALRERYSKAFGTDPTPYPASIDAGSIS